MKGKGLVQPVIALLLVFDQTDYEFTSITSEQTIEADSLPLLLGIFPQLS
jgi:hypothetical protein